MPRNGKTLARMDRYRTHPGPIDTDLVGFEKTKKNNPPKSTRKEKITLASNQLRNAIPVFDQRYYHAYDAVVAFPLKVTKAKGKLRVNGDSVVSDKEKRRIILSICRGRRNAKRIDQIGSLKEFYNISDDDVAHAKTYNDVLALVKSAWEATLHYGNVLFDKETSCDGSKELYKLKMSEDACKKVADVKNYPLQLDSAVSQFKQFKEDPNFVAPFAPFEKKYERTEREGSAMSVVGHIWQRQDRISRAYNKQDFDRHDNELSIFRDTDRLRLLNYFFDGFFNIHAGKTNGMISDFAACHQPQTLMTLRGEWGSFLKLWTWAQPLDAVRDYFGEEVALYYAWLGQFAQALTVPAVFGMGLWGLELAFDWNLEFENRWINMVRVAYCIVLAGWSTYFFRKWSRKEKDLRIRWGVEIVTGNQVSPQLNPYHKPNCMVNDPITPHKKMQSATKASLVGRRFTTTIISAVFTMFCLMVLNREAMSALLRIVHIIPEGTPHLKDIVKEKLGESAAPVFEIMQDSMYYIFLPIVLLVKVASFLWDKVIVYQLAKFENEPLFKHFKDSVSEKSFVFKFMVNLVPVIYLAFLKDQFIEECSDMADGRCILQARKMLVSLVGIGILTNVFEVAKPFVINLLKWFKTKKYDKEMTFTERQLKYTSYKEYKDMNEMMLVFAFISLFASIFPMLPMLAFLTVMIEIRSDAFKLTHKNKRPWPTVQDADTGSLWNSVMNIISMGSVVSNTMLVGLVTIGYSMEPVAKLSFSLGALVLVLCFKEFLSIQIPSESKKYKTQKARSHVVMYEAIWGHDQAAKKEPPVGY